MSRPRRLLLALALPVVPVLLALSNAGVVHAMKARRGVRVVSQRKDWDCGVASLAMVLNKPYGDVAAAVRDIIRDPLLKRRGLILRQVEEVADYFGVPLRRVYRKRDYLLGASGILGLVGGACDPAGHWVVMKDGLIVDPDGGEVWGADDYMRRWNTRPCTLLEIDR